MFPETRLDNGHAIIVGPIAAGPCAALVTGAERHADTLKICSVITEIWRVRLGKKGCQVRPRSLARLPRLRLGLLKLSLLARCLRELRELLRQLLGLLLPSLFRKWTRSTILIKQLFFDRLWSCLRTAALRKGVLAEIRKVVPPHRPPTRKAPKVSREQIVLDMKKKLEKEEQELRERKIVLDQARRLVTEREQKVMDQATAVSALKMELVELRQSIANNPTPEVSEDEDVDATPLGVPVAPPPAVREGLLHFQALNEQHEREEHARQAEAMERASASGTVADDENPSG